MFPIETSKAHLKRIDYDILDFIEYPKSLEEIRNAFPQKNITVKIIGFLDKGLIEEDKEKYVSKFHTPEVKRIVDESNVPDGIKKNFHFFLSQIDNPFVRQNIFNTDAREESDFIFSTMTESINQKIDKQKLRMLELIIEKLMNRLR